MLDKINFTLYEIFGYLLPGFTAVVAFALMFSVVFLPTMPLPLYKFQPELSAWVVIGIVSYLLGHMTQAIGNVVLPEAEKRAGRSKEESTKALLARAKERVATLFEISSEGLDAKGVIRMADQCVVQHAVVGDRDMFIYREGFYKGSTIALSLLSIALLGRILRDGAALSFPTYVYYVSRWQVGALLGLCLICTGFSVMRFLRFGVYRVSHALSGFLVATQGKGPAEVKRHHA